MIKVFKITHNIYDPLTTKTFFKFDSTTRTNGFKIVKQSTNTSSYQHFFTNRVNKWNSLPAHVVNVETVNSFKNALDRHFHDIIYKPRVNYNVVNFSIA